jgi:HEAT repeat protein
LGTAARQAIPVLTQALKDPEETVFHEAALALSSVDRERAADLLFYRLVRMIQIPEAPELFYNSLPPLTRQALAMRTLANLGPRAEEALPEIIKIAQAPDRGLSQYAVLLAKKIDPKAAEAAGLK